MWVDIEIPDPPDGSEYTDDVRVFGESPLDGAMLVSVKIGLRQVLQLPPELEKVLPAGWVAKDTDGDGDAWIWFSSKPTFNGISWGFTPSEPSSNCWRLDWLKVSWPRCSPKDSLIQVGP